MSVAAMTSEARLRVAPAGLPPLPEWCDRLMPGNWKPLDSVWVGEVTVIKENALELLARHNGANRPITEGRVARIRRSLDSDGWMFTGETLIFDTDGNAQSAQHRLRACADSGVPIKTLAVWGVSPGVFAVVDSVMPKSVGQRLAVAGEENYSILASACGTINYFLATGAFSKASKHSASVQHGEFAAVDALLKRFPDIRAAASNRSGGRFFGGPSPMTALRWVLGRPSAAHRRAAEVMIRCVATRSTTPEWPDVNVLTNRLDPNHKQKITQDQRFVFAVKAFNAHMDGRPTSRLMWHEAKGEEYPKVHGWEYDAEGKPIAG